MFWLSSAGLKKEFGMLMLCLDLILSSRLFGPALGPVENNLLCNSSWADKVLKLNQYGLSWTGYWA